MKAKICSPEKLPPRFKANKKVLISLKEAEQALKKWTDLVKKSNLLPYHFSILEIKEALISLESQEIYSSCKELLYFKATGMTQKNDRTSLKQVLNYLQALKKTKSLADKQEIITSFLEALHGIIEKGVLKNKQDIGLDQKDAQ